MMKNFQQDANQSTNQYDEDDVDVENYICKEGQHHDRNVNGLMLLDDIAAQTEDHIQNDGGNACLHSLESEGDIGIRGERCVEKRNG